MSLNLEVQIDEIVYQKIMHWIKKAGTYEVSGLGNVIYDHENHCMRVTEAYLLEQENTGSTTDLDANAVGKLEFEHHRSGIDGELKFWWHSHANMAVFWSKTDLDTIEMLGKGGWFVSTVFNAKEEMRSCFHATAPYKVFADELDTVIMSYVSDEKVIRALAKLGLEPAPDKLATVRGAIQLRVPEKTIKKWDEEYDEKVEEKKYTYTYPKWGYPSTHTPPSQSVNKPKEKESFPDYEPKSSRIPSYMHDFDDDDGLDNVVYDSEEEEREAIDSVKQEIVDVILMYPGITREDLMEMYKDEVNDISAVIKELEKELEERIG